MQRVPEPLSLREFRAGYWFGASNGLTWMVALGTPMVLMTEQLGGGAFQVGLASSFVFLLFPIQVLATSTLARLGFKRQMVAGWVLRAVFLFVPLWLAWLSPAAPTPGMANAMVLSVLGFCAFRAWGVAAHIPWFAAVVPDELRGRFFATEGAVTSCVGVVTLLSCAALFASLPPYQAFQVLYGVAMVGSGLAVASLLRMPSAPKPAPAPVRTLASAARRLCLHPGLFRQYLGFSLVGQVVLSSFGAFGVYYLKTEVLLESSVILGFTAAQFGGQIIGTWAIRHWIDRIAIRRFLQFANALIGGVYAYWLVCMFGETIWIAGLAGVYFVLGVAFGVANTTHVTILPELSTAAERPLSVAVFGAVSGLLSGIGPVGWGLVLGGTGASGIDRPSFRVFLALGIVLIAVSLWLLRSLPEPRAGLTERVR